MWYVSKIILSEGVNAENLVLFALYISSKGLHGLSYVIESKWQLSTF